MLERCDDDLDSLPNCETRSTLKPIVHVEFVEDKARSLSGTVGVATQEQTEVPDRLASGTESSRSQ